MSARRPTLSQLTPEQRTLLEARLRRRRASRGSLGGERRIARRTGGEGSPLSFAQRRLWFLDRLEPGGALYNIAAGVWMRGALSSGSLASALGEVERRHEVLRARFTEEGAQGEAGEPWQVAAAPRRRPLPRVDLVSLPRARREAEALARASSLARRPFDLARGGLLRTALVAVSPRRHLLAVVLHHAVADGGSVGVLLSEVARLYAAHASAGGAAPSGAASSDAALSGAALSAAAGLTPLAIQYGDYAAWERRRSAVESARSEAQLDFWRERLGGGCEPLELPLERARPVRRGSAGGRVSRHLPAALMARVTALSAARGATPYMALLAAYQVLLWRWSGSSPLRVGTPVDVRDAETEGLIGFFVNTVVVESDPASAPSFTVLLERVREAVLSAHAHQEVPYERVVEAVAPAAGERSLFQAAFEVQGALAGDGLPGVELELVELDTRTAKFDLTLFVREGAGSSPWRATVEYHADLFTAATGERLLAQYEVLLAAVAAAPEAPVSRLSLLSAAERQRVLAQWPGETAAYPRETGVAALAAAQARRRPSAPAVEWDGTVVSYGELAARASALAGRLAASGVGRGTPVALALERSPALVVAMLGVAWAGGAYVPLDPASPLRRQAMILDDVAAPVVVGHAAQLSALPQAGRRTVELDWAGTAVDGGPEAAPAMPEPVAVGGDDLAYVLYTSGSTGRPKGVAVPQRAVVRLVVGTDYVRLGPDDRLAQAASAAFDAATFEVWGALVHGATVVGVGREEMLSPAALAAALAARRVTVLFLTTALFNQVARQAPAAFAPLGTVLFGGEAVEPRWVRAVLAAGGPRRLLHVYGPTESTTFATWQRVERVPAAARTVPIGGAVANSRVYVVDDELQPVPAGVPGELVIGGDGLARGYSGAAARSAERFVPDPFGGEPGGRLYRTGDRVRWDDAGRLEFLGRRDHQVKLRGFRIEPGEIEAALREHPAVAEAVVVARRDGGEHRLVAYVAADVARAAAGELRGWLAERVPEYMLPSAVVVLAALPLNRNGKVDRKALPAPPEPAGAAAGRPPAGPLEELVAAVWSEVLGVERVGAEDDFFSLGGHSLLITRVTTRLRQELGVELALRTVFEAPTVAELAAAVELALGHAPAVLPPVEPVPRDTPLPASYGQRRIWFLGRLAPDSAAYNVPMSVRVDGGLSPAALAQALAEVVRRHEVLRTRFILVDGEPHQVVEPPWRPVLPAVDLRRLSSADGEAEAHRLVRDESRRPFDLGTDRLLRAALVCTAPLRWVLSATAHHVVSDGWSMDVLRDELLLLHAAFAAGRPSPLPPLPVQYADYAAWQRRWMDAGHGAAAADFWRRELAGLEPPDLPTDRPRPAAPSRRGIHRELRLPADLSQGVEALARQRGATPFMVLGAGFLALLGRWTGGRDLSLGTPVSVRSRPELRELIGFFVNTVVLRVDLGHDPSFTTVLGRVRGAALAALSHADLPFDRLIGELRPKRGAEADNPLFRVFFSYHEDATAGLRVPGLELAVERLDRGSASFDLAAVWSREAQGLRAVLEMSADLFDASTLSRFAGWLHSLLAGVVQDPERPLSSLPLLSSVETHQVMVEWQGMERELPTAPSLAAAFAHAAAARPDAVAVVDGEERLTYRQLDDRSDRLARRLVELGAGPEVPVGILLERCAALFVAMLAITKAGGTYVPLDPTYPEERLRLTLEDSAASLVVSDRETAPAGVRVVPPDDDPRGEVELPPPIGGESAAYVIYTSGSTGRPKGVVVSHRAVLRLLAATSGDFDFAPGDVWSQFSSIAFDFSVWEIWGCWLHGGRLVVVPYWVSRSPESFLELLERERVTVLNQTPSAFRQLAAAEQRRTVPADLALRTVVFGGEALDFRSLSPWFARRGESAPRMVNMYGITETTVHTTFRPLRAADAAGTGGSRIGRPLADLQVHLLDRHQRPVPPGAVGEIHVGGDGLARGYLGRPRLTAERFVPDPFSGRPGGRLYRSGDLGRQHGGDLAYAGRIDHQVKVRGFRIELGEIESVLADHPEVREAAVTARTNAGGELELVGYAVPAVTLATEAKRGWLTALRRHLETRLPLHMVPAALVPLAQLPLTATGKLDRGALPAPDRGLLGLDQGFVAPRNPVEESLAAIWRDCLGVERVGVTDDFFELGGHSLVLTRTASRLREELGVDLPLRTLFNAPTLDALGVALARRLGELAGSETTAAVLAEVRSLSPQELSREITANAARLRGEGEP